MRLLLVHGLARTPLSCRALASSLRAAGHEPLTFGYFGAVERYERIIERLLDRLTGLAAGGPYGVVGHSLGGLLLRDAIGRLPGDVARPVRFVMIATPNRMPRLATSAVRWWPFRAWTGDCGARLADRAWFERLPVPEVPVTLIGGDAGWTGGWSPFGMEPNDGIVSVSELRLHDGDAVRTVPRYHTWIMNDARVHAAVREALAG